MDNEDNPEVTCYTPIHLVNIREVKEKGRIVTEKPCDTCKKDCVGGIIYGNCQQFLLWRREFSHITVCAGSLFKPAQSIPLPEY